MPDHPPLPDFVDWPIFPFEGELRVKQPIAPMAHDLVREGEGDRPCRTCPRPDDEYLWVDDDWRLLPGKRQAVPALFLETRAHVDLHELDEHLAGELGRLLVRLDRAFLAVDGIGRTHVNRWGDGAAHLHLWLYGRPVGTLQLLGFGLPMWAQVLPPLDPEEWDAALRAIATALAAGGGTVIGTTSTRGGA